MSSYIKSLDSQHLVTVGDEGMFNNPNSTDSLYNGKGGGDNKAYTSVSTIDFGTFHLYPETWQKRKSFDQRRDTCSTNYLDFCFLFSSFIIQHDKGLVRSV